MRPVLPWYLGGALLAIAFFMAVLLVKPIGVSTQFVVADGVVWDMLQPDLVIEDAASKSGFSSANAYLNDGGGKIAAEVADPLGYEVIFVLAMAAGAFLSSRLGGDKPNTRQQKQMPDVWRSKFGDSPVRRYLLSFIAGFIVLFGARLAGGCTSGHMMSGMMQTALSGYLFAAGAFVVAIPLALILYRK